MAGWWYECSKVRRIEMAIAFVIPSTVPLQNFTFGALTIADWRVI